MGRPNANDRDACCKCGKLQPTPKDWRNPQQGELGVWQPNATDPPQWICQECHQGYAEEGVEG